MSNYRILKLMLAAAILAVCCLSAAPAQAQMAQLFEDFGVGPRDSAMGNTGAATANDYSAAFYNPAALVRARGFDIQVGYKLVYPHLFMKIGKYHERYFTQYPHTNYYVVGFTWNIVAERLIDPKWTERFTVGMSLALSDFYKSFAIPYDMDSPYYYRYHDRYLNLLPVYLSLGIRITDGLSVGAGLVPAPTDTWSRVDVNSTITLPDYRYDATQGTVTRSYGKVEPVVGLLLRIPNGERANFFSAGLTWRDEVSTIDGNGTATAWTKLHFQGRTYSLPPTDTPMLTLTGWSPMQVALGLSLQPTDNWTVTVEELWKRWSKWRNFFSQRPDPLFNNTWNTRFGTEYIYQPDDSPLQALAIRLGAYREISPVPNQNGENNYLEPDKWVVSAGLDTAWTFSGLDVFRVPLHLAVAGQVHAMDRLNLHNRADPDYPALETWGNVYSLTATIGVDTD